ncbi:sphingosine kinase 1 isoform X1 [Elaeis guineensis]|uniref:sphingosine kinase n=1 Tax=Elaeis guineensis var. tenera TaxID=51953 RepID=A0A6I9Q9I1_ELAGV|nr:sphingosine kinase 1 isoform X1 [Elaeis guineensis]
MAMEGKAESLTLTERIRVNGVPTESSLASNGTLRWKGSDGGERCLTVESEVLGFEAEGLRITVRAFVGAFKGVSCGGGSFGKRTRRDYVLELPTEEAAIRWSERLRDCINSLGRPKMLFIIVNPFGGKKCGRTIFHNEVKPLLAAADIPYTMQETKHQLHAQEIAYSLDLLKYDGIVCVSGDGVLVEVLNGLLQREDWDAAIKVPLGIIPAGSGNGMAKSLLDSVGDLYSVCNATFAVIRGYKRSLDITTVLQGEMKFFSILMLTWGLVADIDIESEKYRWMGSARFDFYSLLRVMNLRRYHGHVQFVPAPGYESYGEPVKQDSSCMGKTILTEQGQINNAKVQSCGYLGPVASLDGLEWRSIDGPFVSVWINNVPWAGEDAMLAPEAKFSDGCLDAVIIRECPKSALLALMLKMSDGSYVKSPYVTYLKVKAFRLEPGQRVGNPSKGGIVDSDGEVIARGDRANDAKHQDNLMSYGPPIQMTVDPGLATIFSPR